VRQALRRECAFTLIEVLVALAIVAVGMAAVMGALSSSAKTVSYLRDTTFARWVALNQIANLRIAGAQPQLGDSEGDTDFAGRKWHWHQSVVTTEVPGVERIDVSVRPADVSSDEDNGWFATMSGIWGDAVGTPNGFQPDWGSQGTGIPGLPNGQAPGTGTTVPGTLTPAPAPNPVPTPNPTANPLGPGR
jgi:general secretion pathway protein I